jgi:hypothetical protein
MVLTGGASFGRTAARGADVPVAKDAAIPGFLRTTGKDRPSGEPVGNRSKPMPFMLLYIDLSTPRTFNADAVERTVVAAGAIQCASSEAMCIAVFDYRLGDDMITIRIPRDLVTIDLDGTGVASFDIAWRLQQNCPEPIHVIDEQYNFDFVISDFESLESLMRASNDAMNE